MRGAAYATAPPHAQRVCPRGAPSVCARGVRPGRRIRRAAQGSAARRVPAGARGPQTDDYATWLDGPVGLDDLGSVPPGRSADFVVLDANPVDDITNSRKISKVYLRGQEVYRTALQV